MDETVFGGNVGLDEHFQKLDESVVWTNGFG